jgi:hypothetical protein
MTKEESVVFIRESSIPGTLVLKSGWPDFLISREGESFAIEVKRPHEKPSLNQVVMHAALRAAGIPVTVEFVPPEARGYFTEGLESQQTLVAHRLNLIMALANVNRQLGRAARDYDFLNPAVAPTT